MEERGKKDGMGAGAKQQLHIEFRIADFELNGKTKTLDSRLRGNDDPVDWIPDRGPE